jgi:REP element-mobilizing transposase RayT
MAHPRHVHVFGGIYLVSLIGDHGQAVFVDDSDRAALSNLLSQVIERYGAQVHAFKWLQDELLMILQVSAVPISRIVRHLASVHARRVNEKLGYKGKLFQRPHREILLEDPGSILEAFATVHGEPVSAWSSQRAYLGIEELPWLTKQTVLLLLSRDPGAQQAAHALLTAHPPAWTQMQNERNGHNLVALPSRPYDGFRRWLKARAAENARPASLDRLILAVADWFGVETSAIESTANDPLLSLARALIVWNAMENDIASLAELARRFGRGRSTLHGTRETYRNLVPELFNLPLQSILEGPAIAVANILRLLAAAKKRSRRE